mmetsp:Transcript_44442/g.142493  ORF Transcript_44442/g.142493 Transcript_44442/m.142493 type:complete len:240 (+) Transcript_44442:555-1274(+)
MGRRPSNNKLAAVRSGACHAVVAAAPLARGCRSRGCGRGTGTSGPMPEPRGTREPGQGTGRAASGCGLQRVGGTQASRACRGHSPCVDCRRDVGRLAVFVRGQALTHQCDAAPLVGKILRVHERQVQRTPLRARLPAFPVVPPLQRPVRRHPGHGVPSTALRRALPVNLSRKLVENDDEGQASVGPLHPACKLTSCRPLMQGAEVTANAIVQCMTLAKPILRAEFLKPEVQDLLGSLAV